MPECYYAAKYLFPLDTGALKTPDYFKHLKKEAEMSNLEKIESQPLLQK